MGFYNVNLKYTKHLLILKNKWKGGKKEVGLRDTDPAALVTAEKPSLPGGTRLSLAARQPPPGAHGRPPRPSQGCGLKPLVAEGPRGGSFSETRMSLCASLTF